MPWAVKSRDNGDGPLAKGGEVVNTKERVTDSESMVTRRSMVTKLMDNNVVTIVKSKAKVAVKIKSRYKSAAPGTA